MCYSINKMKTVQKNQLIRIEKKKKINLKKFLELANRVKKIFEEEEEYLERQRTNNAHNQASGVLFDS